MVNHLDGRANSNLGINLNGLFNTFCEQIRTEIRQVTNSSSAVNEAEPIQNQNESVPVANGSVVDTVGDGAAPGVERAAKSHIHEIAKATFKDCRVCKIPAFTRAKVTFYCISHR